MGVKIKRERADQRRHHRVTAPLFVGVDGHTVRATDWSLGGLRVDGFPHTVPPVGKLLDLSLTLPFQGFDVAFGAKAKVVRTQVGTGTFAVQFTELGERERELMSHFLEELVRGSMVDVEDTIQRIDVPVTPASLQPDTKLAPVTQRPVTRMPVRTMVMSGVYALVGMMIFGYAAMLLYSNVYKLEVRTAVIAAPVDTVKAQADGRVALGSLKPGDQVADGDVILEVIDSQLEREIELSDLAIRERKAKLGYLKQRYLDELEKMEGLSNLEMRDVEQLRLDVEAAEATRRASQRQYERLRKLFDQGFTTEQRLDEAEAEAVRADKTAAKKKVELATRVALVEQGLGKRHYNGRDLIGGEAEMQASIRLAEHEILLAQKRHMVNLTMRDRSAVRAPFEGTVLQLPRPDRSSVRRGDVIAVIEQSANREILAFLSQEEVSRVGLGDTAQVWIPAIDEVVQARVTRVDRTSGFIAESSSARPPGYRWRGPEDRSAEVTLEFMDDRIARDWKRYRAGLPVTILFDQRARGVLGGLTQRIASIL